jgi:hypothetical protein
MDRSRDRIVGRDAIDAEDRFVDRSIVRSRRSCGRWMRDARVSVVTHPIGRVINPSFHPFNRWMAFSVTLYPHPGLFHAIFMKTSTTFIDAIDR